MMSIPRSRLLVGPSRRPHLFSNTRANDRRTGGEPNAGDHGEGEDGVHHLDAQPFGLARAAAAVRRGAECSAAGVGWATIH